MKNFLKYFSSVKLEMKKVSWSTKQELITSTLIVFIFAVLVGIFLWLLDDKILGPITSLIYYA